MLSDWGALICLLHSRRVFELTQRWQSFVATNILFLTLSLDLHWCGVIFMEFNKFLELSIVVGFVEYFSSLCEHGNDVLNLGWLLQHISQLGIVDQVAALDLDSDRCVIV